jgi:hypothetical protein
VHMCQQTELDMSDAAACGCISCALGDPMDWCYSTQLWTTLHHVFAIPRLPGSHIPYSVCKVYRQAKHDNAFSRLLKQARGNVYAWRLPVTSLPTTCVTLNNKCSRVAS